MRYAPIIIPTLNRAEHLKRCVESLKTNPEAKYTDLYISVDYPPDERYYKGYPEVKEYVKSIDGFGSVNVFFQDHNLGAMYNLQFLRDQISSFCDGYIQTEDDNEFSKNALDYINKGLELYKDDRDVTAICCCNDGLISSDFKSTYFKSVWHNARGVGQWFSKDKDIRKYISDQLIDEVYASRKLRNRLSKSNGLLFQAISLFFTGEMPVLFDGEGKLRTIDYSRSVYNIIKNKHCIMPMKELARNWGYDGTGVNTHKDLYYNPEDIVLDPSDRFEYIKTADFEEAAKEAFGAQRKKFRIPCRSQLRAKIIIAAHNTLNEKQFDRFKDLIVKKGKK